MNVKEKPQRPQHHPITHGKSQQNRTRTQIRYLSQTTPLKTKTLPTLNWTTNPKQCQRTQGPTKRIRTKTRQPNPAEYSRRQIGHRQSTHSQTKKGSPINTKSYRTAPFHRTTPKSFPERTRTKGQPHPWTPKTSIF